MKIYALIPIKHNSERVIGKNYRDFNGKPLFYWIINTVDRYRIYRITDRVDCYRIPI